MGEIDDVQDAVDQGQAQGYQRIDGAQEDAADRRSQGGAQAACGQGQEDEKAPPQGAAARLCAGNRPDEAEFAQLDEIDAYVNVVGKVAENRFWASRLRESPQCPGPEN